MKSVNSLTLILMFISSGSMLIVTDNANLLVDRLKEGGISAVIGQ